MGRAGITYVKSGLTCVRVKQRVVHSGQWREKASWEGGNKQLMHTRCSPCS